uniref:Uncharacterized protein n=1 Tax=Oryza rufipogon TaxID=4529 RepID=A0A0E0N3I1_ORYRU
MAMVFCTRTWEVSPGRRNSTTASSDIVAVFGKKGVSPRDMTGSGRSIHSNRRIDPKPNHSNAGMRDSEGNFVSGFIVAMRLTAWDGVDHAVWLPTKSVGRRPRRGLREAASRYQTILRNRMIPSRYQSPHSWTGLSPPAYGERNENLQKAINLY